MGTLIEDATASADRVAVALTSSGYRADFSADSLIEIDRFFDEHARAGRPVPGGLLAAQTGQRIFALAAYVGQVLRRGIGGHWQADDVDPQGELTMSLLLPDGHVVWPMQRVFKRMANGREDSIAFYATMCGLDGIASTTPITMIRPPVPPS
jgi:hypothetical protein